MTAALARFFAAALLFVFVALPGQAQEPAQPPSAAESAAIDTLIEVLKDDQARQGLIEQLEKRAGETPAAVEQQPATSTQGDAVGLGGRVAEFTQSSVETVANSAKQFWRDLLRAPETFSALARGDYGQLASLLLDLVVLVAVTYAIFLLGRLGLERFRRMLNRRAEKARWWGKLLAAFVVFCSDLILILIAWGGGTLFALTVIGDTGRLPFQDTLFLNAFVVVEALLALVGAVLSPRHTKVRAVPLDDQQASALDRWFRFTLLVAVYCQLLLVPVFNRFVSIGAGRAVSVIGYMLLLALIVNLVLRWRDDITNSLVRLSGDKPGALMPFLVRYWHVPVLAYLIVLFGMALIQPEHVLIGSVLTTFKIVVAVAIGLGAAQLLSKVILSGVKLPANVSGRIPLLEQRLNAFVPHALTALRLLIVITIAAIILDAIGLFSLTEWLDSEFGSRVANSTITIALILLIAFASWLTLSSWVDYRLQPGNGTIVKARQRTLMVLMRNAVTVTILAMAAMLTLSELGINIAPLLASAGVVGLAIGFGAQKLVQDIITGIFIQVEGAIDVGDVVNIAGVSGSVERLTIRSASLRDVNGVYHVIPFSSVDTVSNFMRGYAFALCDMSVAYREDVGEVKDAMIAAFERLKQDPSVAIDIVGGELEWMGLDRFADSAMVLRARIKTLPGRQWAVNRAYNSLVKAEFDERGIEIPMPRRTIQVQNQETVPEDGPAKPARKRRPRKAQAPAQPAPPEIPDSDYDDGDADGRA